MNADETYGDVSLAVSDDHVATVEIHRPPDNFFDAALIQSIADAFQALDADDRCRAIVLCSEGKHFCAGAALHSGGVGGDRTPEGTHLYDEAVRMFSARTPVVAAVQGAAIGGGLGVACAADFRVAAPEARFAANFARMGFHHGFGLTVTLPRIVGHQRALELLYTGERVKGEDAFRLGLADRLVPLDEVRDAARAFAADIATSGPLAVTGIRDTMRGHLADQIRAATQREQAEQDRLRTTSDFREGVKAMAERRTPHFEAR
jgi:2-(1,2-epoxy-1,2-dihydrophenyl)acetyl-CoA isomerase